MERELIHCCIAPFTSSAAAAAENAFSKGHMSKIKSNRKIQKRHFGNKEGITWQKLARYAAQMLMKVVISYRIVM
jgi:hypothetical protein